MREEWRQGVAGAPAMYRKHPRQPGNRKRPASVAVPPGMCNDLSQARVGRVIGQLPYQGVSGNLIWEVSPVPMIPQTSDLSRFVEAQRDTYQQALSELRAGRKQTHWMWFIFPQLAGLGQSSTSRYYGLKNIEEARAYLEDPVLGGRLKECTEAVLEVSGRSAMEIFGGIDSLKFRSSLTLFCRVAGAESLYQKALDRYFEGEMDARTIELLD